MEDVYILYVGKVKIGFATFKHSMSRSWNSKIGLSNMHAIQLIILHIVKTYRVRSWPYSESVVTLIIGHIHKAAGLCQGHVNSSLFS